jgi:nucleoside-diphosphate-sugar epimerase
MRVLVTGACGNIGRHTLQALLEKRHTVRAFDISTPGNMKIASQFDKKIDFVWGDIRNKTDVKNAVEGQDAIIHLSYIIPPMSQKHPEMAEAVNIDGLGHIIAAARDLDTNTKLIFASSYSIHGDEVNPEFLLTTESPLRPLNNYHEHKIIGEKMVSESGLNWCIFRLGAVMSRDVANNKIDPLIFDLPFDSHQEFLHSRDAALAFANCLDCEDAWGQIFMVGGGKDCQLIYMDLINRSLWAMGIGNLPKNVFSPVAKQGGGWMDTSLSQRLLQYQNTTFDDYLNEIKTKARFRRPFIRLLGPFIRWYIARQSPYNQKSKIR